MALHRGIQSAVFYYLSCAPCFEAEYARKRKREAAQSRLEREELEKENPNLYRHPSPSSTNPYWQADIALGPIGAVHGKRKANNYDANRGRKAIADTANLSADPSSVDLGAGASSDGRNSSTWNTRPYQREDEELWGSSLNVGGEQGGLRRPPTARTKDSTDSGFQSFPNPPVNDLHPAIVTKVASREDIMWMMQPTPVAEVMSGKERAPRSRSDSGTSRLNSSSVALSREPSNTLRQQRSQAADSVTPMTSENLSRTVEGPVSQRHDRSATTSERDFAISPIVAPTLADRRTSPLVLAQDAAETTLAMPRHSQLSPEPDSRQHRPYLSRPKLSTIASANDIPDRLRSEARSTLPRKSSTENHRPAADASAEEWARAARPATIVVQSVSPPGKALAPRSINGKVVRTSATATEIKDALRFPPLRREDSSNSASADDALLAIRPGLFDSWYTPDFELPQWIHEHTRREVQHRWSMDL